MDQADTGGARHQRDRRFMSSSSTSMASRRGLPSGSAPDGPRADSRLSACRRLVLSSVHAVRAGSPQND